MIVLELERLGVCISIFEFNLTKRKWQQKKSIFGKAREAAGTVEF